MELTQSDKEDKLRVKRWLNQNDIDNRGERKDAGDGMQVEGEVSAGAPQPLKHRRRHERFEEASLDMRGKRATSSATACREQSRERRVKDQQKAPGVLDCSALALLANEEVSRGSTRIRHLGQSRS